MRELQSSKWRNFCLRDVRSVTFMEIALQIVQELTKKSRLLSKALRVGYVNPQMAFHMIKAKQRNLRLRIESFNQLYQRSVELHNLRYTEFYGDGDSKSFSRIKNIYQDAGILVEKKECIGHVQKRVGTALRKLKRDNPGLGGKGKLTDNLIDKLQNYYG